MPYQRGSDRPTSKLTEQQVIAIRTRYGSGETLCDLAAAYPQVSKVNLHHIVNDRRWTHLPSVDALRSAVA